MVSRKAYSPAKRGCYSLRLLVLICLLHLGCIMSVSSFKNIFSSARWGRSLLPRKSFISGLSFFRVPRAGGDEQTQSGETDEEESEYETEEEAESMWIGDENEKPRQHQVDADSWFEGDQEADQEEGTPTDHEEDLGVTDLDDEQDAEVAASIATEEEMEEEFYDALEEAVVEEEQKDGVDSEKMVGVAADVNVEIEEVTYVSQADSVSEDFSERSNPNDVAVEEENVNSFEVNEVVANYPEGSVDITEAALDNNGMPDGIEASMDDEGSSPTDVYPEEPHVRPETFSEEEGDQFEDLTGAGTANDLVPPVETAPVEAEKEEPVFVSDTTVQDGGALPMGSSGGIEMELTQQHITTDDDSTAFLDRMELADAEDEGESTAGGYGDSYYEESRAIPAHAPTGAAPTASDNSTEGDDAAPVSTEGDAPVENVQEDAPAESVEDVPVENEEVTPVEGKEAVPVENEKEMEEEVIVESQEPSLEAPTEQKVEKIDDPSIRILRRELRYTPYEVKFMKPQVAVVVVEKKLKRPQEGMPLNWYVDGKGPDKLAKAKQIAKPILFAAFASFVVLQNRGILLQRTPKKSAETESIKELADDLVLTEEIVDDAMMEEEELIMEETNAAPEHEDQGNWLQKLIESFGDKLNEILSIPKSIFERFQ